MVRTKKFQKKSSKKKLTEFSMSDRKGSVIIGNNIPSAEKKCVKEKSKEVAEERVLDNNNLKDYKPQSNHNSTSSLFQVIEIPGKNLGCVATQDMPKGTLISNENPQLKCRKDGDWMQDLMAAFMAMRKKHQKAFMNLYDDRNNIVTDRNLELCNENTLKCISREFETEKGTDSDYALKIFKILCLYESNQFPYDEDHDCVGILSARFNHSCRSNAESVEYQGNLQIFAIRDIKKGEEISINYGEHFEMFSKTFAERQKYFKETTAFSCICDFCQNGEEDENDIAIYEAFKKNLEEISKLQDEKPTSPINNLYENLKRQIECYDKLFKIGRGKEASPFLLFKILKGGFNTAVDGLAAFPMILSNLYFKDACQNFAKLGEEIQKEFGFSVFGDEWQKRTNFDEWYNSQNQEKVQNLTYMS